MRGFCSLTRGFCDMLTGCILRDVCLCHSLLCLLKYLRGLLASLSVEFLCHAKLVSA